MLAVSNEREARRRGAMYFVIGKVAKNIGSSDATGLLISRLAAEDDKYLLSFMLDRLAELPKPPTTAIQPIIDLTRDERWQVRHAAIGALNKSTDSAAETLLIAIVEADNDPYDVTYALSVLNRIGTARSVVAILKHVKSRKRDIRVAAQLALEEITKRTG